MKSIRVILVEDDEKWIIAMKLFLELEPDIEVAAVCCDYKSAIDTCISLDADIVLMDISLSGNELDGIYATAEILCQRDIKVIMLTSLENAEVIQDAYRAGAVNYVLKTNYKEIPSTIRNTLRSITPNEILAKDYMRLRVDELLSSMTATEKEIFKYLSVGKSKKEILECLFISENTLKNHTHSIIHKLEVKSIQEAVEKVKRKGFIK